MRTVCIRTTKGLHVHVARLVMVAFVIAMLSLSLTMTGAPLAHAATAHPQDAVYQVPCNDVHAKLTLEYFAEGVYDHGLQDTCYGGTGYLAVNLPEVSWYYYSTSNDQEYSWFRFNGDFGIQYQDMYTGDSSDHSFSPPVEVFEICLGCGWYSIM